MIVPIESILGPAQVVRIPNRSHVGGHKEWFINHWIDLETFNHIAAGVQFDDDLW